MYDCNTKRKIEALKKKKQLEIKSETNSLGLTIEERKLLEQVIEFKELALTPSERKAYEKVIMTIKLNALARNEKI